LHCSTHSSSKRCLHQAVDLILTLFLAVTVDAVPEAINLLVVSVFFGDLILAAIGCGIADGFISIGPAINALVAFVAVAFALSRRSTPVTNSSDGEEKANGSSEVDLLNEVRYQLSVDISAHLLGH